MMKDCPFVALLRAVIPADIRDQPVAWTLSVLGMIILTCALQTLKHLP